MKKFKKALLHVGPDKTGSTAIQATCDASRSLLMKHGVLYPTGHWHAELGSCFCDEPEKYIFNRLSGFKDREKIKERNCIYLSQLCKEIEENTSDILVLSYEGFVHIDEISLIRFRNFISQYATTCEVVFYVRSPLSYAKSAMSQRVKNGLPSWPDGAPPVTPFRTMLAKLGRVFGKEQLNVRKFARDTLPKGDVVLDFLSLLNLPDSVINRLANREKEKNTVLSAEALQIGERMIGLLAGRAPLVNPLHGRFVDLLSKIEGEKIKLSALQLAEIKRVSKRHCDYLFRKFGISFAVEADEAGDTTPLISTRTVDSLAELLWGLILPEMGADRKIDSPDLTLISAVLREDKDIVHGQLMTFDVDFMLNREISELETGIHIFDEQRRCAFGINSTLLGQSFQSLPQGSYRVSHHLVADLPAGSYTAGFAFAECLPEGRQLELSWRDVLCKFQVHHKVNKTFAGYSNLAAEISLCPTTLIRPEMVVSEAIGSLEVRMPVLSMAPGEQVSIGVSVVNRGEQVWVGDSFRPVNLSYHWLNKSGEVVFFDGVRTPLPAGGVAPGQILNTEMLVEALNEAGAYILVLTLVQEEIEWFENIGFKPAQLTVEVSTSCLQPSFCP